MNSVLIGSKVLEVPIIQGGMGVGISLGNLAGAVMKEGGMGVISAAHPGYRKKDFWQHSLARNIEALHEEIEKDVSVSVSCPSFRFSRLCDLNNMHAVPWRLL